MVSLRGVHWFNSNLSDLPHEGWNVETVIGVMAGGNSYNAGAVANVRERCQRARDYGLTNIVRLDYQAGQPSVPKDKADLVGWAGCMGQAIADLLPLATLFVVGNEPTIEGRITPRAYADAFNLLYQNRPAGSDLLVAGPAPWSTGVDDEGSILTDLGWLMSVSRAIPVCSGFALHAYGTPGPVESGWAAACPDPAVVCASGNPEVLAGDWGFRRYRDQIAVLCPRWQGWPVYLTEFNTFGFGADFARRAVMAPEAAYPDGFIPRAYEDVRSYNVDPLHQMDVRALCWFVDDGMDAWWDFALSGQNGKMPQARAEFIGADTSPGLSAGVQVAQAPASGTDGEEVHDFGG